MNSGVMPAPGTYRMKRISREEYVRAVKAAIEGGEWSSSIGYPDNVELIRQLTGFTVPVSRDETNIVHGDTMLIMKLKYRTDGYKRHRVSLQDFEFFQATYAK